MHFHRNTNSRLTRAFPISGLQQIKLASFNRELEILHVAKMLFELVANPEQLFETLRHLGNQLRDILGSADAGDHIFSLCVE